ncbi:hypothetical protein FGIG_08320 [Fasciola gigantica]|uniref:Phosphatidylinositol-glycan biosynthesis class X protein n=1 Tax=Fasciola gigantica TaxID=46835 RepID=A0A504YG49_FASGI|nr:hypothetical protein FGIG_08320 [Fasciola gigantica]
MNFTLSKPAPRGNQSSVLGRWLLWLSRGDTSADEIIPDATEIPMNRSEVDVEAPSWMADAMTVNLHLGTHDRNDNQSDPLTFQIPVHIRYRLPRDDGISIDRTQLAHPSVKCDDGFEYNKWNTVPPFELPIPVPPASDLLFVMPLTILLLVVGLVVLLMA